MILTCSYWLHTPRLRQPVPHEPAILAPISLLIHLIERDRAPHPGQLRVCRGLGAPLGPVPAVHRPSHRMPPASLGGARHNLRSRGGRARTPLEPFLPTGQEEPVR